MQCQIDEISNHGLNRYCGAHVDDLPYDYREADTEFRHVHGNGLFYDTSGHFGKIEGCAGNVVHKAVFGVVYDEKLPRFAQDEPEPESSSVSEPEPESESESEAELEEVAN